MTARLVPALLLWCLLAGGAVQSSDIELESVPRPPSEGMLPALSDALQQAYQAVEQADTPERQAITYGHLGDLLFVHEYLAAARISYRNALQLNPEHAEWHHLLGMLEHADGRLDQAIAALDASIELRPESLSSLVRRGQLLMERGDVDAAIADFQRVLSVDARASAALAGMGKATLASGDHGRAANFLERALEIEPGASRLYQPLAMAYRGLGNTERAREHLARVGERAESVDDPAMARIMSLSLSPHLFLESALQQADSGNLESAAASLQRARQLDPGNALVLLNLGEVLARLGRIDQAHSAFSELVRVQPSAQAHFYLGQTHELADQLDTAAARYREALALDADHGDAKAALAGLLQIQGEPAQAASMFAQLAEIETDPSQARMLRYRQGLAAAAAGDCAQALSVLEDARQNADDMLPSVLLVLSRVRAVCPDVSREQLQQALSWAEQIYQAEPAMVTAETLAMVYASSSRFEDAEDLQAQAMFEALKQGVLESRPDLTANMQRYRDRQGALQAVSATDPLLGGGR